MSFILDRKQNNSVHHCSPGQNYGVTTPRNMEEELEKGELKMNGFHHEWLKLFSMEKKHVKQKDNNKLVNSRRG